MTNNNEFDARLTVLETKDEQRDKDIANLEHGFAGIARDVNSIKRALWVISGALAANIPVFRDIVSNLHL